MSINKGLILLIWLPGIPPQILFTKPLQACWIFFPKPLPTHCLVAKTHPQYSLLQLLHKVEFIESGTTHNIICTSLFRLLSFGQDSFVFINNEVRAQIILLVRCIWSLLVFNLLEYQHDIAKCTLNALNNNL